MVLLLIKTACFFSVLAGTQTLASYACFILYCLFQLSGYYLKMKLQGILSQDCKHELTISRYIMRTKQIYCLPADFLPLGLIRSEQKEARISMSNEQFLCLHFTDWSIGIIDNYFIKNIYIGRHDKWIKYSMVSLT